MHSNETNPRELLLSHLDLLRQVAESVCHRHNAADLAEDFHAELRLKLIDNDYDVLRRFRGEARFSTYLVSVVNNFFVDYTHERWGRWRPSTAARRLGPQAVEVETLVHRDGFSHHEAVRIAAAKAPRPARGDGHLEETLRQLPHRRPRPTRVAADASALDLAADEDSPELAVSHGAMDRRTEAALERALDALPPKDRALLKLRYADGFSVAEIARVLHLDQKKLYRRIDAALARARQLMEAGGLTRPEVTELSKRPAELRVDWGGRGRWVEGRA